MVTGCSRSRANVSKSYQHEVTRLPPILQMKEKAKTYNVGRGRIVVAGGVEVAAAEVVAVAYTHRTLPTTRIGQD